MKNTKSNNYGRGFYYAFADGYQDWTIGLSAAEKRVMIRQHGALVKWIPA